MADITQIKVGNTTYDINDAIARSRISNLGSHFRCINSSSTINSGTSLYYVAFDFNNTMGDCFAFVNVADGSSTNTGLHWTGIIWINAMKGHGPLTLDGNFVGGNFFPSWDDPLTLNSSTKFSWNSSHEFSLAALIFSTTNSYDQNIIWYRGNNTII